LHPEHFVNLHSDQLLFLVVLRLSARNVFLPVDHFPRFQLNVIHSSRALNRKHLSRHRWMQFRLRRGFLSLPAMRCQPDAGSFFLVIAVQSFTRGIHSVNGGHVPISITRKNRDHVSSQSEKKPKTIKAHERHENPKKPTEWEWAAYLVPLHHSLNTNRGCALQMTGKTDQRVLCNRASWSVPSCGWVASR
jgi:hypothetical protein